VTLLFDIGNSRIKWQESHRFSESPNAFSYNQETLASQLDRNLKQCCGANQDVIIVSVAGDDTNSAIESWIIDRWQVGVRFLQSESSYQTLYNGYANFKALGVDRWYALIGAVQRYSAPFLVCDIGSAVTIDIVDKNGIHLGGYITPGIEMMIRSLSSDTNIEISHIHLEREVGAVPDNTNKAIVEGCLWSVASLITSINERLGLKGTTILTGGDAETISPLLDCDPVIDKNLIFHGIECVLEAP